MSNREGPIQAAILQWLAAEHILAFRMQVGAVKLDNRFVRFGTPGMADILAFPKIRQQDITRLGSKRSIWYEVPAIVWIELKAPNGKQSELQKSFQAKVESEGHRYLLVRDLSELEAQL